MQFAGKPEIVGIEKGDEVASRQIESGIARRRHAAIGLAMQPQAWKATGDHGRAIAGAIVNNNDVQTDIRLIED